MSEIVHYEADRAIATITLDSPANRNALSAQLVTELDAHLHTVAGDPSVRAVVLTHTGRTFCAGADLKEQATEGGPAEGTRRMLALLRTVIELVKPVIARVDGNVRAGGLGLVGACDIAFGGPSSTFAFTEVRLGLAPAIISLTTLGRMSERAAARYYLTGETFDAAAAAASGLITAACEDVDAELAALTDALRICAPQGLAETKTLTTRAVSARFHAYAEDVQARSQRLFESDQAREGIMAFLEKRPPSWAPQ
ncbi:MAG: enoyl-CoA hydratase family protein [Jatrophihabitantaceae bacterium]